MIWTAIMVVCLASAPTDCRTYEQPMSGLSANPGIAFLQAQVLVADWVAKHPRFQLQSFTIEPGRGA